MMAVCHLQVNDTNVVKEARVQARARDAHVEVLALVNVAVIDAHLGAVCRACNRDWNAVIGNAWEAALDWQEEEEE
jgi:hypothetical protein